MSSQNNSKGAIKPLIWWIAFGVSCLLLFTPVPTWIGVIAVIVTFFGAAAASKPLVLWIVFGVSFLLFFAPVPIWIGVIAVIVTFFGVAVASQEADEKEDKRLEALANQGDLQAQYDLACRYQNRKKWSEAIPLFEQAAKAGHAQAQLALPQARSALEAANKKKKLAEKPAKEIENAEPLPTKPQKSDFSRDRTGTIEYFIADALYTLEMIHIGQKLNYLYLGFLSSLLRTISDQLWSLTEPPSDNVVRSLHSLVNQVDDIRDHLTDTGQIFFQEIKKFLSRINPSEIGNEHGRSLQMRISEYDLCEKCRNLKIATDEALGEFIQRCNVSRGGSFTDPRDFILVCECIKSNIESMDDCPVCTQMLDRKIRFAP